jgi:threonine/homoserine/homoserine lactone efflux protein
MLDELAILKFIAMGGMLGLTAGMSPGPLLTLVISETLSHSKREGIRIAISPLITDIPIVVVSLFVFSRLNEFNSILGVISLVGGIFVAYLGYETIQARELPIGENYIQPESLKKGIIANFLSPHPYLFWVTVGAPLALEAYQISLLTLLLFFLSFYLFLTGSKIVIALLVAKSKAFLKNKIYTWVMRILGFSLFVFSVFFISEGVSYLSDN